MTGVPLDPGTWIGQYEIEKVLGAGGFGITYRAFDHDRKTTVAIKEYFPRSAAVRNIEDGSVWVPSVEQEPVYRRGLDRFWKEAENLARFHHPHIVGVKQVFMASGTAYIVLEYIPGQNLEEWAQTAQRQPTQEEFDNFCTALLSALEIMHENKFLHRDLGPKNILLRDGLPVLIDFGSARIMSAGNIMTAMVTPNYAPYEQHLTSGQGQGAWTDVYGASATMYRLLAGRPPVDAVSRALDDSQYEPLAELVKGRYRRSFLEALDWGLRVMARERPQSIAEWRGSLLDGNSVARVVSSGLETQLVTAPEPPRPFFDRIRGMLGVRPDDQ